jgi:ferric-dicitrate binding protein FerR (iron transport regulator)
VWLNSGSRFQYPVDFNKRSREVFLEGEAYFDITHLQNDLHFTVKLNENLQIRVLGTEFNVKSYETDPFIEATLVKGSIRMIKEGTEHQIHREINLKPNEKATYIRSSQDLKVTSLVPEGSMKKEPVSAQKVSVPDKLPDEIRMVTAWKDEELVFHNESFEDIAIRMERWFGMKIRVEDDTLRQERFTGKFVNNETIYQILDIFNRSEGIQYSTKDKAIIITRKRKFNSLNNKPMNINE